MSALTAFAAVPVCGGGIRDAIRPGPIPAPLLFFQAITGGSPDANPSDEELTDESGELDVRRYENLMIRYQGGDERAAAELIASLHPRLTRYFAARMDSRSYAGDLAQDFWLRLHRNRHTYRPGEPFLPWFYSIARNTRVDGYRRRSRIERMETQTEVIPEVTAAPPESRDDSGFHELLRHLPESQREALILLKVEGLTLEEVARATATTAGAVKQ